MLVISTENLDIRINTSNHVKSTLRLDEDIRSIFQILSERCWSSLPFQISTSFWLKQYGNTKHMAEIQNLCQNKTSLYNLNNCIFIFFVTYLAKSVICPKRKPFLFSYHVLFHVFLHMFWSACMWTNQYERAFSLNESFAHICLVSSICCW